MNDTFCLSSVNLPHSIHKMRKWQMYLPTKFKCTKLNGMYIFGACWLIYEWSAGNVAKSNSIGPWLDIFRFVVFILSFILDSHHFNDQHFRRIIAHIFISIMLRRLMCSRWKIIGISMVFCFRIWQVQMWNHAKRSSLATFFTNHKSNLMTNTVAELN